MFPTDNERAYKDTYCTGYINRYTFEFDFLPNVLPPLYKKGEINDYDMTHPSEWKKVLLKKGVRSDFGIDKMSVEKKELDNGNIQFIYTFPKPEYTPECYFAILHFDKNKDWKYYTLELDYLNIFLKKSGGIVCGQKDEVHLNYGAHCKDDLEEFQKLVQNIIDGKPNHIFASYDGEKEREVVNLTPEKLKEECFIF